MTELQAERDQRKNEVEIMMSEINQIKQTYKHQNCEIKNLTNQSDKVKKYVSKLWYTDINRFLLICQGW